MEVRIGVVYTARELDARDRRLGRRGDRSHREPRSPNGDALLWLTDTKGRTVGVPADKIAYVEIVGRRRRSQGRLRRRLARAVVNGPAPDLLDRRCLFFTGKGGVGKSTMAAATALLAAEHRQAGAARRGRRQGRRPRAVRARAGRLHAARGASRACSRWRWTPRRRCRSTCKLNLRVPVLGRSGRSRACSTSSRPPRRA